VDRLIDKDAALLRTVAAADRRGWLPAPAPLPRWALGLLLAGASVAAPTLPALAAALSRSGGSGACRDVAAVSGERALGLKVPQCQGSESGLAGWCSRTVVRCMHIPDCIWHNMGATFSCIFHLFS
jgi:hypothetical protein